MRVDVYSHHDVFLGTINEDELLAFSHSDENNGEDSVSISTLFPIKQDYRLVWQDWNGIAHEHICQDPKGLHANGATIYTDTALNSICETFHDYIEDKRPYSYGFAKALEVALEPTRWSVGTVDQSGTVSSGLTFYHTSCREALQAILECGGELETVITVDGLGVTKRAVNIRAHRGETATHKRFAYGKDVTDISRTEHWGAITACYGYGKGVETDSGGYGRKLTFGDINGGLNYVADAEALKKYGRPDGSGGFAHKFGEYENSDCEDAEQLLTETKAYLEEHKEPGLTYEANVIDLVQFGREWEGCGVGDDVQVVDTDFEPELRLEGRVSKLVVDYVNKTRTVTLGNVTETMASAYAKQQTELRKLSNRSSNWDVAALTPGAYLQQIIDGLNEQFNTNGMSYCYTSFETGTIWSSVPLDENGKPTKTGGSAIQICSQGFRIASTTKSDGSYDWRTFGTGTGFTADEINAGTLNAGLINAGILSDCKGKTQWNLETGELIITDGEIDGYATDAELDTANKAASNAQSTADTANKAASTLQTLVRTSGKGVEIARKVDGTYTSTKTLTDDSGFHILDASGNEIASYEGNKIELGKNSNEATIEFCGGEGRFSYETLTTSILSSDHTTYTCPSLCSNQKTFAGTMNQAVDQFGNNATSANLTHQQSSSGKEKLATSLIFAQGHKSDGSAATAATIAAVSGTNSQGVVLSRAYIAAGNLVLYDLYNGTMKSISMKDFMAKLGL